MLRSETKSFALSNTPSLRVLPAAREALLAHTADLERLGFEIEDFGGGELKIAAMPAFAQNVKITPIGSHPGELCANDRAMIFEDPTGVRILYDAGQSVTGGNDPRLGEVHMVLLSHAHGDHMGDRKLKALEAGSCEKVDTISAAPHSTTAEIAAKAVLDEALAQYPREAWDTAYGSSGTIGAVSDALQANGWPGEKITREALDWLAQALAQSEGSWRVRWLVPE